MGTNTNMKLCDLLAELNAKCPPLEGCEDQDGVAFLPDPAREARRIAIALDANPRTAKLAADAGAELFLTHHPMLYGGEPEVGTPQYLAREILLSRGIAAMSLHARLDAAAGGMNDTLCRMLGIFDEPTITRFGTPDAEGLGRIGKLSRRRDLGGISEGVTCRTLSEYVKARLGAPAAVVTLPERELYTVAVVSGSCSDFVPLAAGLGADAIIGGEFKYHTLDLAVSLGISCIGVGHYYSERHAVDLLARLCRKVIPAAELITVDPGCPAEVIV